MEIIKVAPNPSEHTFRILTATTDYMPVVKLIVSLERKKGFELLPRVRSVPCNCQFIEMFKKNNSKRFLTPTDHTYFCIFFVQHCGLEELVSRTNKVLNWAFIFKVGEGIEYYA